MSKESFRFLSALFVMLSSAVWSQILPAQQVASSALPNAPGATAESHDDTDTGSSSSLRSGDESNDAAGAQASKPGHQDRQPKRILGVFPNFRSVTADEKLPPQTIKDKFVTASEDSFDYSAVALPLGLAAYDEGTTATPEFHGGAAGYGRYLWHSATDQTIENYMVEFIVPAVRHEDTRYYTLGRGGFVKRTGYAFRHVVITRSDSGKDVFNSGEVVGSGLAALIANAYYPSGERTAGNTVQKWGTSVGIDLFSFALREFWPDINHSLFHGKAE